MRKNVIFWSWAGLFAVLLAFASQPVGLNAQFAFGLFGVAFMLVIRLLKLSGPWKHMFLAVGAAIVFRYMYWRITATLPPISDPVNFFFGMLLFTAEAYSVFMLALSFFIVSDPIERKHVPLQGAPEHWPSVDIFVPSYNEGLDLVGTTLAAAQNIDYPQDKLKVFLLDDGGTDQKCNDPNPAKAREARERRVEMMAFCEELGVQYITRARNEHAKAGNLNSGLEHSSGDLVVVFDADHSPTRDFLKYTVGYFQKDPKLFLVQTPHFFLNPDPVEKNLETFHRMPSENEMFYSVIQKGLDKWNGTFFCGSAAVLRREALQLTAGFSGESITEDCETALELHSRGWNSVYVDRPMIAGLQPETFSSFIGQRSRWAQGMMQILMLKKPMFRKGLTLSQRIAYTSSPLFWLFPFSRLTFMIAPALYVYFDLQIYNASLQEFIAYTMFFLISNVLVQNKIYGQVRWPWISELYEYVQSLYLAKAIVSVVLNPRAPSFVVTAKGETLDESHLSPMAWPYFLMFGFLALTTGWAIWRIMYEGAANELLLIVTLWSIFNLLIAGVALGVVSERRERRRHYRIDTKRRADFIANNKSYPVMVDDCSIGGMRLRPLEGLIPFKSTDSGAGELVLHTGEGSPGYPLKVNLKWTSNDEQGPSYGVCYTALSAMDRRAVATILYPDHHVLETIRKRRHTGRSVPFGSAEFIYWAVFHTFRGFGYLINDLRQWSAAKSKPVLAAVPTDEAPNLAQDANLAPEFSDIVHRPNNVSEALRRAKESESATDRAASS
ncbi:UDP-forming cellulose synthase catalytic subunit [Ahrensia sp. AH-315-G08]|nr:UDP-forming cellulose synthase catalytic subunit [Ahrensia sp. AH-315-G08]